MAISIASEATGGTTTDGSGQFSVTKPATVNNGDMLLVIVGKQDDPAVAPPGDWSTLGSGSGTSGNDAYIGVFYKFVVDAGTEPASYTFDSAGSGEQVGWWIGSMTGISALVNDVTAVFDYRSNAASPATSALTTVTPNAMAFAIWAVNNDNDTDLPGGAWVARADNVGGNGVLSVASQIFATRGTSTGTPAITNVTATEETEVGMIVLRDVESSYIQVSTVGAYLENERHIMQASTVGAYLEIEQKKVRVSVVGAYLEIEEIPVGGGAKTTVIIY